jgi:hypothetical protein
MTHDSPSALGELPQNGNGRLSRRLGVGREQPRVVAHQRAAKAPVSALPVRRGDDPLAPAVICGAGPLHQAVLGHARDDSAGRALVEPESLRQPGQALPAGRHQDVEGVGLDDGEPEPERGIAVPELVDANECRRGVVQRCGIPLRSLPHSRACGPRPRLIVGRRVRISMVILAIRWLASSERAESLLRSSTADRLGRGRSRT